MDPEYEAIVLFTSTTKGVQMILLLAAPGPGGNNVIYVLE